MIRKTNETVATGTTTNTALLTQKKKSILIIGGSGGTGHVALQMSRYYWNEHVQDVTVICSKRNVDFCYQLGATHVVTYDNDNTDDDVMTQLSKLPSIPFDIVLDCVTSDDPRDQNFSYPEMIQQHDNSKFLLANDYIYRRLGGSTMDWIRAGVERVIGLSLWKTKHEKLFWIKFPKSSSLLQELATTMERDDDTASPNDDDEATKEHSGTLLLPPIVESQNVYPFTKYGVEDAFGAILSRRVRGKVVIEIIPSSS